MILHKLCLLILYSTWVVVLGDDDSRKIQQFKAMGGIGEVGVAIVKAVKNNDLASILEIEAKILQAVPYLAPFAGIVSGLAGLYPKKDPTLIAIKNELVTVNSRLFSITGKLDELLNEIGNKFIEHDYRTSVTSIENLKMFYLRFSNNPGHIEYQDILGECYQNHPIKLINWLKRQFKGDQQPSLRTIITRDYDEGKFLRWSTAIMAYFSEAVVLHSVCVGLRGGNHTAQSQLTLLYDGYNFYTVSRNLLTAFYMDNAHIRQNYFVQAKIDAKRIMSENTKLTNKAFADTLYKYLADKYTWRFWYVGTHDGDTYGGDEHWAYYNDKSYFWIREDNRCLFISSTNSTNNKQKQFANTIHDNYVKRDGHRLPCESSVTELKPLYGNSEALMCVRWGHGFRATFRPNVGISVVHDYILYSYVLVNYDA